MPFANQEPTSIYFIFFLKLLENTHFSSIISTGACAASVTHCTSFLPPSFPSSRLLAQQAGKAISVVTVSILYFTLYFP